MAFPPSHEEIRDRLLTIVRPPPPPWLISRWQEEAEAKREALGLGAPWERKERRARKERPVHGSKMIWPWRIAWEESLKGRGQIKVLENERVVGNVSYEDLADRQRLLHLIESIVRIKGK